MQETSFERAIIKDGATIYETKTLSQKKSDGQVIANKDFGSRSLPANKADFKFSLKQSFTDGYLALMLGLKTEV